MTLELIITAWLVGLLGGVHCLGMCGPIAGALTFQLAPEIQRHAASVARFQFLYNLGRVGSYMLLGALAGSIGWLLLESGDWQQGQRYLMGLAGAWMLILAAWLLGWSALPTRLEGLVAGQWHRLSARWKPLFLPVRHPHQAALFGLLWGVMPCGLVYSTLLLAVTTGSVWQGSLVMLAFGLGSLPLLLLLGMSGFWLVRLKSYHWLRYVAASMTALFGAWLLWQALFASIW
jgi:sulfite exporter TauE/SafE